MVTSRIVFSVILLAGAAGLSCRHDATSPTSADEPQYITVRRAWRAGERDSLIQFVTNTGAWGEYSDLAAQSIPAWDSAVDVIVNPAWRDTSTTPPVQLAPEYASGWGVAGFDIHIVYDSTPDVPGVQADSLDWVEIFWWNPADSTWKGFLINATTQLLFPYVGVNTTAFNSANGQSGSGAGEVRLADTTYWEGTSGNWRVTVNNPSGVLDTVASGVWLGGNLRTGLMTGNIDPINPLTLSRKSGRTAPKKQTLSATWTNIALQQLTCYFTPVTPPSPYSQCTGVAAARLIALARAGVPMATFSTHTRP